MKCIRLATVCSVLASLVLLGQYASAEDGFGSISGKFVFKGKIPKRSILHKKGANVKNADICAVSTLYSDELIIDEKTKGIANVFVYLRKKPKKGIYPKLKNPPDKKVIFNQKHCQFQPHALLLRTGQTVLVTSSDNCSHNTHVYPLVNEAQNFVVPPNFRKGVPLSYDAAEPLPIKVKCDIHSWMSAYWLILNHPYAAVTQADGSFKIDNLPAGKYQFRVWHEKAGYINVGVKRGFKTTVPDGKELKLDPFEITSEKLK